MARRSVLLVIGVFAALAEGVACNAVSGVGDYMFGSGGSGGATTGSKSASSASGAGHTTSAHASSSHASSSHASSGSGSASGGGDAGGQDGGDAGLEVPCDDKDCPVVPDAAACCFDNPQVHPPVAGRCVSGPRAKDGCSSSDIDGGRETRIECQLPADCPHGEVCCGQRIILDASTAYYQLVACVPKCTGENVTLCDPKDLLCPMDAGSEVCQASMLLPSGYYVCNSL